MIDRGLGWMTAAGKWLALPVAVLLLAQWPLREWVQRYSRETNDMGQWMFALLIAVSVVAATRAHLHLATDILAAKWTPRTRRLWSAAGIVFGLLPWALFILWAALPMVWQSVAGFERFPDTGNPAYFVIKVALALLLVLVIAQAVRDLVRSGRGGD